MAVVIIRESYAFWTDEFYYFESLIARVYISRTPFQANGQICLNPTVMHGAAVHYLGSNVSVSANPLLISHRRLMIAVVTMSVYLYILPKYMPPILHSFFPTEDAVFQVEILQSI